MLENRISDLVGHMLAGCKGRLGVLVSDKLDALEETQAADVPDVRQGTDALLEETAEILPASRALSDSGGQRVLPYFTSAPSHSESWTGIIMVLYEETSSRSASS